MQINNTNRVISDVQNAVAFDVEANPALLHSLSSGVYTKKVLAPVREYISNALDIHQELGVTTPIRITLPTNDNLMFQVQDIGSGLSDDQIYNMFIKYGASTKRESDTLIGGFGIGCKSAFAYSNNFTVTSVFEGTKTIYSFFKSESNEPQAATVGSSETLDPNGVTVTIPVKQSDVRNFEDEARYVLGFHNPDLYEINSDEMVYKPSEALYSDSNIHVFARENLYYRRAAKIRATVGGIEYKVSPSDILDGAQYAIWEERTAEYAPVFVLSASEVPVALSREEIQIEPSKEVFINKIKEYYTKSEDIAEQVYQQAIVGVEHDYQKLMVRHRTQCAFGQTNKAKTTAEKIEPAIRELFLHVMKEVDSSKLFIKGFYAPEKYSSWHRQFYTGKFSRLITSLASKAIKISGEKELDDAMTELKVSIYGGKTLKQPLVKPLRRSGVIAIHAPKNELADIQAMSDLLTEKFGLVTETDWVESTVRAGNYTVSQSFKSDFEVRTGNGGSCCGDFFSTLEGVADYLAERAINNVLYFTSEFDSYSQNAKMRYLVREDKYTETNFLAFSMNCTKVNEKRMKKLTKILNEGGIELIEVNWKDIVIDKNVYAYRVAKAHVAERFTDNAEVDNVDVFLEKFGLTNGLGLYVDDYRNAAVYGSSMLDEILQKEEEIFSRIKSKMTCISPEILVKYFLESFVEEHFGNVPEEPEVTFENLIEEFENAKR